MTATAEVSQEITLPVFTCAKCAATLPHATHCRVCKKPFEPGVPFCVACRTFTAPLDKTPLKLPDGSVVRRGCPGCGHVPNDETLRAIGEGMIRWAQGIVAGLTPQTAAVTAAPVKSSPLGIRILQRQVEVPQPGGGKLVKSDEIVEYDLMMRGIVGTEKVAVKQSVMGDMPMGEFLKGIVVEYDRVCAALKEATEKKKAK
jgi:hypothetical protein